MSRTFVREYPIRFSHCDPAGIVYFPRLFDLLHEAYEDWFRLELGAPFAELLMKRQLATPTVSTKADFLSPARLGDVLRIELVVTRLGQSAMDLGFEATIEGRTCLKAKHTVCMIGRETQKAVPIPADLRERLALFVRASADPAGGIP